VALAPFHDKAGVVSAELQTELDGLKADIVAGTITVTSPSTP
jgi:basic membrane protein A